MAGDFYIMQEDDGKAYVWMADKNNQTEQKQEVTLGDYDEDEMKYEITDGLTEDDYITVPQDGIQEGAPVIYDDACWRTHRRWTVHGATEVTRWMVRGVTEVTRWTVRGATEVTRWTVRGATEVTRWTVHGATEATTWMQIILMEMPVTAWSMMQIRAAMSRMASDQSTGRLSCDPEIGAYL